MTSDLGSSAGAVRIQRLIPHPVEQLFDKRRFLVMINSIQINSERTGMEKTARG
jgi:hypothetical protein